MSVPEYQKMASKRYLAKHDELKVRLPKEMKKADVKAHADDRRESVNGFVVRAIKETMERDKSHTESQTKSQTDTKSQTICEKDK